MTLFKDIGFQTLVTITLAVIAFIIAKSSTENEQIEWIVGAIGILVFAVWNLTASLFRKRWIRYIGISTFYYILMCFFFVVGAEQFCEVKINQIDDSTNMLLNLLFGYPVLVVIVGIIKSYIYKINSKFI